MEFSREDFNHLRYNPYSEPMDVRDILDSYQGLSKYPEFDYNNKELIPVGIDKIIRYIFMMYQEDSPLMSIEDINQRRVEAAKLVGFKMSNGKFSRKVEEFLTGQLREANKIVIRFLRVSNSRAWSELRVFEDTYYSELKRLRDGDLRTGEKTETLHKTIKAIRKDIDALEYEILNQDKNQDMVSLLYEYMNVELMCPSPEDVVNAIKDGTLKELIPNYYYD